MLIQHGCFLPQPCRGTRISGRTTAACTCRFRCPKKIVRRAHLLHAKNRPSLSCCSFPVVRISAPDMHATTACTRQSQHRCRCLPGIGFPKDKESSCQKFRIGGKHQAKLLAGKSGRTESHAGSRQVPPDKHRSSTVRSPTCGRNIKPPPTKAVAPPPATTTAYKPVCHFHCIGNFWRQRFPNPQ